MTSIDKLIAQARELAATTGFNPNCIYPKAARGFVIFASNNLIALCDEVERLNMRVASLKAANGSFIGIRDERDALRAEIERLSTDPHTDPTSADLRAEVEGLRDQYNSNTFVQEYGALHAENKRLRAESKYRCDKWYDAESTAEQLNYEKNELLAENEALWKAADAARQLNRYSRECVGEADEFQEWENKFLSALAALPPRKETT